MTTTPVTSAATTSRSGQLPGAMSQDTPGAFLDAYEALANAVVGLVVSWSATYWVLGYSVEGSAAVTGMFFVLSFTRAWAMRRLFRWMS